MTSEPVRAYGRMPSRGPDVKFPPPVLFVGGLLLGVLLDRVVPSMFPASAAMEVAGAVLVVAGLAVVFTGIITFRRARTAVYPNQAASRVVAHGIYAYTRNPMYLGMTVFYVGGVMLVASSGALLLLPLVHLALHRFVILREERHLRDAFPVEYAAYCAEVRRWC